MFGGGSGGGGSGFSDFFEALFGARGARRGGARYAMRGQDVEAEVPLTLEEAHRGVKRKISLQVAVSCLECNGTGVRNGKPCPTCRGAGTIRRPKTIEVTIPPGVREASVIRLAGQGEPGSNGAAPGDLFLRVRIQPHRLFNIVGENDVQIELPVAPWEAALGANLPVPTLDGPVEMKIPAGAQGGQRLRLRGQGLNRRGGGRGDEYVRLKIVNPPSLAPRERELYQQLATESRFNPRELMAGV
jgi:DnaJ-class molecular chaperone